MVWYKCFSFINVYTIKQLSFWVYEFFQVAPHYDVLIESRSEKILQRGMGYNGRKKWYRPIIFFPCCVFFEITIIFWLSLCELLSTLHWYQPLLLLYTTLALYFSLYVMLCIYTHILLLLLHLYNHLILLQI